MVQVYADGVLVYDPYMEGYELLELKATQSTDKAGTATIVLPADHPAYNSFVSYRTLVEIYRKGELLFRGRALYPADDFYNNRTITCEGERCFLNDAVVEPYLYQADPRAIFVDVITKYNAQVDEFKRFKIGTITARDPNDYQYIKAEDSSPVMEVIDKLLEYVGGFLTFSTDSDGDRCINWLASLDNRSGQTIEFGENLLDYSRTDSNAELATVIYPFGKKDDTTKKRVDISAVNGGKLYIQDDEAVALRGRIAKAVFWDDVTLAGNLLKKAQAYLATSKMVVSTLELTAVDLSVVNRDIDSFRVGDNVRVLSTPHGVDDVFLLRERSYDLLEPSQDKVVLGNELVTLTGSSATTDKVAVQLQQQSGTTVTNVTNVYNTGGGEGAVSSVNGQVGDVLLDAETVGAAPAGHTHTAEDVGALKADGTAVNAAALGGKPPKYYVRPINHMINGNFKNPVNQSGVVYFKKILSTMMTIDQWGLTFGTETDVYVESGGLRVITRADSYAELAQYLKLPDGKYTFVVKVEDEVVYITGDVSPSDIYPDTFTTAYFAKGHIKALSNSEYQEFTIHFNDGVNALVEWAALYEGVYDDSNMPPYVPKDYGAELADCQRLLYYVPAQSIIRASSVGISVMDFLIPIPPMRKSPSFNTSVLLVQSMSFVAQTGFTCVNFNSAKQFMLRIRARKTSHGLSDGFLYIDGAPLVLDAGYYGEGRFSFAGKGEETGEDADEYVIVT